MFFRRRPFSRALLCMPILTMAMAGMAMERGPGAGPSTRPTQPAAASDALTLLEAHCVRCHGGESTKGGLDLRTREAALRGGDTGPALIPGKPQESLLLQTIRHDVDPHMPHKAKKLPDEAIAKV